MTIGRTNTYSDLYSEISIDEIEEAPIYDYKYDDKDELDGFLEFNSISLSSLKYGRRRPKSSPIQPDFLDYYNTSNMSYSSFIDTRKSLLEYNYSFIKETPKHVSFNTKGYYDNASDNHYKIFGNTNPVHIMSLKRDTHSKKKKTFSQRLSSFFSRK
jgi:hypothetical protein